MIIYTNKKKRIEIKYKILNETRIFQKQIITINIYIQKNRKKIK